MDINESSREPEEDEAILDFFLGTEKTEGQGDSRCYSPKMDSGGESTRALEAEERSSSPTPTSLDQSGDPHSTAYQETRHFSFDPFDYSENEMARSKMISHALQQEDEFLEYLMSLPISQKFSEVVDDKHEHCDLRLEHAGNIGSAMADSEDAAPHSMQTVSKVGLDHLDNLCKLMEQLGELRDQNSKLQRRVQYLEDLKSLHDMHKQLQESLASKRKQEGRHCKETNKQMLEESISLGLSTHRPSVEDNFQMGDSLLPVKRHASEESVLHYGSAGTGQASDAGARNSGKRRSHPRSRQSLHRRQYRERSRSVGHEEVSEAVREAIKNPKNVHPLHWQRQRRGHMKSKVSKWTKVKEAFRWEKAQLDVCRAEDGPLSSAATESKSQDSGIGMGKRLAAEERTDQGNNPPSCFHRVDSGKDGETTASQSDSLLENSSSHYHGFSYALSSSSSSSDDLMEIDLNFSGISEVIDIGPQRSASATDSTADKLAQQEAYNERRGRRSLSQGLEEDASRRSKSLDCEDVQRPYTAFTIDDKGGSISKKAHRTAWGKVKDIIQTRRDSVKKRQKEEGRREVEGRRELDADPEDDGDRSGCESADDCAGDALGWQYGRMEEPKLGDRDRLKGFRPASPPLQTSPRRLTPTLTVTLPSNEELSGTSECGSGLAVEARKFLQGEPREARSRGHSTSDEPDQQHLQNSHRKKDSQFSQLGDGGTVENVGATSPPAPRRPSKWTKVKKAFLTARKEVEGAARGTINATSTETTHASLANSPSQCYQCQARRLADRSPVSYGLSLYLDGCSHSGINTNSKMLTSRERRDGVENATKTSPAAAAADSGGNAIERDIQKSYSEMQHNLGQEFHKKLSEWERMKGGWCTRQENKAEECEDLRKKVDEWQRTKDKAPGRCAPPTDDSHLPIDFRKRLSDWRRIRVAASGARTEALGERPRAVTAPRIAPRGCVVTDEESLPPQFRKRLVEWQLWRAVTGKSDQNVEELHKILPEEFYRKLLEWERIKGEAVVPVRVAGGRRYDRSEGRGEVVVRKDASALGRVVRRMRTNEVALGDKWSRQRNDVARESKHRGKEVQWLEKELQKVEREKLRLEREREKYLEREARLERMRRAMGQRPPGKQEVLIQTSTGFFRFQGISEKFTRKLYEWEKQRGIGPEASTFALLDPTYRPVASSAMAETRVGDTLDGLRTSGCSSGSPLTAMPASLVALPRSRSEGSLAESGGPMHSRSSSLVGLEVTERDGSMDKDVPSRASSEPRMRSEARGILVAEETEEEDDDEEETAALLVEVEDVEEETAAALEELPTLPSETPIYSYAPEEVTRLIDSSGSESDRDGRCNGDGHVHRTNSIRTQSSYELIEENMSLINKLKLKENICRKLENEIEDLEGKIQDIAKTHQEELERLRREETGLQGKSKEQSSLMEESGGNCAQGLLLSSSHGEKVAQLKLRVNQLERCKEQLKQEEKSLQTSFQVHSEQQEALAQNLVGKMKLLQEVSKVVSGKDKSMIEEEVGVTEMKNSLEKQLDPDLNDSHSIDIVQHLSTELLQLAEKLEVTLADRNQEIRNLRLELQDRKKICRPDYPENKSAVFHSGQRRNWSSAEGVHLSAEEILVPARETPMNKFPTAMVVRQSSEELSELPFLLTNKVLELKRELSNLCNSKGIRKESEPKITSQRKKLCRGKLQRIPNFQKEDEDYDPENTPEEFIPDRDNQACDKSKQEADISPSKPEEDEPMERVTSQPSNTFYLTALESVGRALEDVTNKCIDSFRTKPSAIEKEEEGVRVSPSERNFPSSQGERKEEEKEHKGEVDGEEARGINKGTRCGIDDGSKVQPEVVVKAKEKHLKTRRISDTHVTYDSSKPYKNSRACVRDLPRNTALALVKDPRDTKGTAAKDIPKSPVETDKWIDTGTNNSSGDATDHPTPNVFVQTTRKIFSPVCGSIKGSDASSVVGYVVEYLEDGSEADEPGGMPPWRRRGGAMQPQEVTASRPCRPLGDTRKTTDTCNRTGIRSETPSSPSASSHPLPPPSPLSIRREKTKETAPSIRLMIAKYDLKQQQQQEGSNSGRSPEARSSGGRSPAWLSPTADRRDLFGMGGVKAQMEKYQEEVRKALVGYSNPEVTTVQKSASAGLIRSFGAGTCLKPPLHSIAKSSSVGTIKSRNQADDEPMECASGGRKMSPKEGLLGSDDKDEEDSSSPMNDSIENTLKMLRERHPSPPSSPSRSHKFAHVRAMRLKKAKEEFMKRTSVAGADLEDNSHSKFHSALRSTNVQLKKEEEEAGGVGKEDREDCEKELCMRDGENECDSGKREGAEEAVGGQKEEGKKKEYDIGCVLERGAGGIRSDIVPSRHSQISFESESSYEDSAAVHQGLIKSASSGMIDIYSQKNKYDPLDKLTERENDDSIPSSNYNDCLASTSEAAESHRTTKVGIMSRFRKAKMRTKKMNVISALCRQSLLVSVDKEYEKDVESVEKNQAGVDAGKQKVMSSVSYPVPSCRSCPSSPVPSSKKPENSGCWSHNPKHVFKPRRDREENVPKTNVRILLPHKKQI